MDTENHGHFRIGTRGSPMALMQTAIVRRRLEATHPHLAAPGAIETVVIKTTGDRVQHRQLAEIGGKQLFTKEIEDALLAGVIDIAVHSMKDVATWLPEGLEIACLLPRDDPRDAFLSPLATTLAALPKGALVGTSSPRRQAQILERRPDLKIVPMRGNAGTRMSKLAAGECDATLLGIAGLRRIGEESAASSILSVEEMLPAVSQGVIGIECRAGDLRAHEILSPLHHLETSVCNIAERSLLAALGGSCRTPIAGLARLVDDRVSVRGLIFSPDGARRHSANRQGLIGDAAALGADAGAELRAIAGPNFFAAFV
jgi:hydroxymethylbilane synthase